jgi:hypothetical protein
MTLFKEYLAEKIITDEKTQTRRPKKEGDQLCIHDGKKTVVSHYGTDKQRIKMQVGRNYAIQYGRGKPCRWWMAETYLGNPELMSYEQFLKMSNYPSPWEWILEDEGWKKLRYTITDIRNVDVRNISWHDSIAEGFENPIGFWKTWCKFYDPTAHEWSQFIGSNNTVATCLKSRPDNLYQAWAYDFEVLK